MNVVAIKDNVSPVTKWNPRKDAADSEITYIDIGGVSQDSKEITSESRMPGSEAPSRARQLISQGDILVSTVRPNLNAVAVAPEHLDGATASTGFCVLRPIKDQLDNRYLFHWVRSPMFVASMVGQATGQSYPAVSDKIVKSSEIPLPSLEMQKRIAAILDQADELRRLRQAALDKLNILGQSIFFEMFGDPQSNTKHIKKVSLGDLIKVSSGDGLTSGKMRPGDFPVYGGNGINGRHDETNVDQGTIVIGRVGVYCGSIHVTETKAWVTDNALIVRKKVEVETDYLASALKVAHLNQYAGRSSQPLISGTRIYPVQVLFPPLTQQKEFSKKLAEAQPHQVQLTASHDHLSRLFSSLQHRAFKGEL